MKVPKTPVDVVPFSAGGSSGGGLKNPFASAITTGPTIHNVASSIDAKVTGSATEKDEEKFGKALGQSLKLELDQYFSSDPKLGTKMAKIAMEVARRETNR